MYLSILYTMYSQNTMPTWLHIIKIFTRTYNILHNHIEWSCRFCKRRRLLLLVI